MNRLNRAHVDGGPDPEVFLSRTSRVRFLTLFASAFGLFLPCTSLFAKSNCKLMPGTLAVDQRPTGNSDANGMLEPGETVDVEPSWARRPTCIERFSECPAPLPPYFDCSAPFIETGTASPTLDFVLLDDAAQYHSSLGFTIGCSPDCYSLFLPAVTRRPARHWEVSFNEVLSGTAAATASRKVHVGDSFADVARTHPFYKPIETLLHDGLTNGCTPPNYCPDGVVTRSEGAILLAKAVAKGGANIPASGWVNGNPYDCAVGGWSLFEDVAPTDPLCRHAHYVAARNIMKACGSGTAFCPAETISRAVMAVFVARAMVAAASDAAEPDESIPMALDDIYSCDPARPNSHFADVPASNSNGFCKFVNFLWMRFVVAGCGPNRYCPSGVVTRDQMAKFIVRAFGLTLNDR